MSCAPSLIPVLVTGIQSAQVLGLEKTLFRRTDVRRLDSWDKHRNEGVARSYRKRGSLLKPFSASCRS